MHSSKQGFIASLIFHIGLFGVVAVLIRNTEQPIIEDSSEYGEISTNIAIEMMQAIQIEPEIVVVEKPKIEVPDPTIKKIIKKPKPKPEPKIEPKVEPKPEPKIEPKVEPMPEQKIVKKTGKKSTSEQQTTKQSPQVGAVNSIATTTQISNQQSVGAGGESIASYRAKLIREIEKHKSYPMRAKSRGVDGFVHVSIKLKDDGSISSASIAESSGHGILDDAAIKAVQQAKPIGPKPANLKSNIIISIEFGLS